MRTLAIVLATLFLVLILSTPLERNTIVWDGFLQALRIDKSSDVHAVTGEENCSLTRRSRSVIQVYDGENKRVSIFLGSQSNLTWITVENSTIIRPSADILCKIDSNLLNLTGLVRKGYIADNQTNIIWSFANTHSSISDNGNWQTFESLLAGAKETYLGKNSKENMHYYSTRLNYSTIFELAQYQRVDHIWLDRRYQACLDQSVSLVKDPTQWAALELSSNRSIDGSGVKIAVLDTGIDSTHPDFSFSNGTSKIVASVSFTDESTADGYGHGTHCASIAAGTGAASGGRYKGLAPGAALLNVKVLDNDGYGLESWIISGIQWAVDSGAKILSMSIGGDISSDGTDPLSTTVDWATEQGVVCAVAIGNSGPETYTIMNPATAELAIAVGASSKSDTIASFSSRGPTIDNRIKPDIVAPGVDIVAARATGTSMGSPVSQYYTQASGTSMATPHVAGAAALLLDAHPSWDPGKVKMALVNYAKDINANLLEQGSGRLDVCKSANASILGDPGLNIGRVHLNTNYEQVVQFRNVASGTISLTLIVEVWSIEGKTPNDIATLNTSTLTITPSGTKQAMLFIHTSVPLPAGFYEGRITATYSNSAVRIRFLLIITSELNVRTVSETGSTLLASYVLVDANTLASKAFFDELESARFFMPAGNYVVQAMNINLGYSVGGLNTGASFIVHKAFSIATDETINLTLSLASVYKLTVKSSDIEGSPLHLISKQIMTPYYTMGYTSDAMGTLATLTLYLSNVSQYMKAPCFFGFTGLPREYVEWLMTETLRPEIDIYFMGWDLSRFGLPPVPSTLGYVESDLATFKIQTLLPSSSSVSTMWFSQLAGLWQSLLWRGFETHPGINWKAHILPYQFKAKPNYSELEWSCIYTLSTYPDETPEYYVIDRHFQSIEKGEVSSYTLGKTPLLPQDIETNPPYYGDGLFIPFYPLRVEKQLFLAKSDGQATKRIEIFKDGLLLSNSTKNWAKEPISISQILNSNGYGYYDFTVKTRTGLQCSSQNVAEYVINYSSSSTDLIPPSIERMDCAPCFAKNSQYPVKIKLADNDLVSDASLSYSLNDGPWTQLGLENAGGDEYSASLNLAPATQKISLLVEATDRNGNKIRFNVQPVAIRGYSTEIGGTLNNDVVSGRLTLSEGSLVQPLYVSVKSGGEVMYTLTDIDGTFGFLVPQSMAYPIEISIDSFGPYEKESWLLNQPTIHDISITGLVTSRTISSNYFHISVTVKNKGNFIETFNVTLTANATIIFIKNMILEPAKSLVITFVWDVTNVTRGSYKLSTRADAVSGETETADNTFDDGWIHVTIPGDVNADGSVNIFDIAAVAIAFSSTPADTKWNPNADLNEDQLVDIFDLVAVSTNYG